MNKLILLIIIISVLFGLSLYCETQKPTALSVNSTGLAPHQDFIRVNNQISVQTVFNRDPDYQAFAYNAYDPSGILPEGPVTFILNDPAGLTSLAPTTLGDFIAAATWMQDTWIGCEFGSGDFYMIDIDGTMILIGGNGTLCNAVAFDDNSGTLYGADYSTGSNLYAIDPATGFGTLVGNISGGIIIGMACDNDGNLYGVDLTDNNLYSIDPATGAGTIIGTIGININYAQDMEYDKDGETCYLSAYVGSGKLYTCDLSTGATTLVGEFPNGIEVTGFAIPYTPPEPGAPAAPGDLVVTPDPGGALSCDLSWICPDLTFAGDPLTELLEMRVYRNEDLVYTDTSPLIGEPGNYTDVPLESGLYEYSVAGYNSAGEGPDISEEVWVGEDVPNIVADLLLEEQNGNGYLTWDNPTTGLHSGVFNEPILGFHIERNDGVVFEVAGIVTEFLDDTIPGANYYYYNVTAYNSVGNGGTVTSNTEWIGDAFTGIIILDLDPTPTGTTLQSSIQNFYAGQVVVTNDWNAYPLNSDVDALFILVGMYSNNHILTEAEVQPAIIYLNAEGNVYLEGGDTWFLDTATSLHSMFNINSVSDGWADLFNVNGQDFLAGMIWTYSGENNWIDRLIPIAPAVTIFNNPTVVYDCGIAYDSGTYKTIGTSFEITGLEGTNTLDDAIGGILTFFGLFSGPGYITGSVTLAGVGPGNVEDVEVTAGYVTVNPDETGFYEITIIPGTYNVTAALPDYDSDTVTGVVVEEGVTTSGINLTLVYNPVLTSPVNLNVECIDNYALFTWYPPVTITGFYEDFEGTFPPDGWLKLNPDGGTGWEPLEVGTSPIPGWMGGEATACPNGDLWQAFCTWTTGGATMNDQWLITPQITVEDADELAFYMIYYFDSCDDYIEILISTTVQNDPDAFDIVVDEISFTTGSCLEWELYSYNLTDFVSAGTDVYIAFRETVADINNDGSAISIDNVYVGSPVDRLFSEVKTNHNRYIERATTYMHVPNTHIVSSRDLLGYNVYLDGVFDDFTTETEWQFFDLVNGEDYTAGVSAMYDTGESEIVEINFEYTGSKAGDIIVAATELKNNYPNPFNPAVAGAGRSPVTNIAFSLKEAGHVMIDVYNVRGQLVKTLVNDHLDAAYHVVTWNGKDNSGKSVTSGIYFYKMCLHPNLSGKAGGRYTSTKKMILLK